MNAARVIAILGACAMSLTITMGQRALADESQGQPPTATAAPAAGDGPTAQEVKKSTSRGIFFKVPGSEAPVEPAKGQPVPAKVTKIGGPKGHSAIKFKVKHLSSTAKETAPDKPTEAGKIVSAPAKATKEAEKAVANQHGTKPVKTASQAKVGPAITGEGSEDQGETVIKAWLNKTGKPPCYKNGDKMEISVNTSKDCNLVIYDFDGKGTLTQIFPNDYQKEGALRAGDTVTIGGVSSSFDFQVSLNDGNTKQQEKLFIFAYPVKDEAPLSVAMAKVPSSPFRSAPMSLEQYRDLVNQSKVYFARSVTVKAKGGATLPPGSNIETVAANLNDGNAAPNKMELTFAVEK